MTISNDSRARIKRVFEPIALGMGRLGLTPDALTLIGFAITVVGAVLVAAAAVARRRPGHLPRRRLRHVRWHPRPRDRQGQQRSVRSWTPCSTARAKSIVYLGDRRRVSRRSGIVDGTAIARRGRHGSAASWSATPGPSPKGWASRPGPAWPPSGSCPARSGWSSSALGLIAAGILGTAPFIVEAVSGAGGAALPARRRRPVRSPSASSPSARSSPSSSGSSTSASQARSATHPPDPVTEQRRTT